MNPKRIRGLYGIVLSVSIILAGFWLMVACVDIYQLGDHPFTPETVAAAFASIALPVYICIGLIFGGFLLEGFLPADPEKVTPEKQYPHILAKLYEKHGAVQSPAIRALQRTRKTHRLITFGLLIVGSAIFLAYCLNIRNFDTADITSSVRKAVFLLLPCMAVPFAYGILAVYCNRNSLKKEIALVKEAVATGYFEAAAPRQEKRFSPAALRWVILGAAIFLLVFGFFTGGAQDVLTKAVNICTECVGLG